LKEAAMTDPTRTFAVASDEALVELISRARSRLVVIAPALTKPVADAVARRLHDLGRLSVTVILDTDPEVYRLGFGDQEALDFIRAASAVALFDLREQPGVRIGVVVSDDTTMVYSPVSKNIEAGSNSVEKPNAIVLTGGAGDRIATAAGADMTDDAPKPEVGEKALVLARVQVMQADLKANPPKPFDIARKMNIFTSRVQYVEFSASNYQLTTRQIALPSELVDVANEDLKKQITSRIRPPFDDVGKLDIKIGSEGSEELIKVDDQWLRTERKRIEDEFTFPIQNFGRVILYTDRDAFDKAVARFKEVIVKYQAALRDKLGQFEADFEKRIIAEFAPRWRANPPKSFSRWNIEPTEEAINSALQRFAHDIFEGAISFEAPKVKVLYKNVAPENIRDIAFLDVLRNIMLKRRVPPEIIVSIFESGQAVPEAGTFRQTLL
jgi:hypothetical protein